MRLLKCDLAGSSPEAQLTVISGLVSRQSRRKEVDGTSRDLLLFLGSRALDWRRKMVHCRDQSVLKVGGRSVFVQDQ
jgi:hypothetical protein